MNKRRKTWVQKGPRHQSTGVMTKVRALIYTYYANKKKMAAGLIGAVVALVLGFGGLTAAFADSPDCTVDGNGVKICTSSVSAESSDSASAVTTAVTTSKTKVTLANYSATPAKISGKKIKVNSFCDGIRKTMKTHQAFTVMKTDTKCKWKNHGLTTAGKPYEFTDWVGSNDSRPGTISATFLWVKSKVKGKTVWGLKKGNCLNDIGYNVPAKKLPKTTVTQVTMVTEWTAQLIQSVLAESQAKVTASQECVASGSSASASASAWSYGKASASQSFKASGKTLATAIANTKKQAKEWADKQKQSLMNQATATATSDVETRNKVSAEVMVKCASTVTTPPTTTPTPTPTPTPKQITVCKLDTKSIVTIDENEYNSNRSQYSTNLDDCKTVTPPVVYIPVCELSSKKIITIDESKYDDKLYTRDLKACDVVTPPVVKIPVCELATKNIVTINEADFDAKKYSKNLDDCKTVVPPVKYIPVCDTVTKKIVSVDESNYDKTRYTTDLNQCKETPPPAKITVCELSSKQIVTINESDFDSSRYSKNLDDCKTVTPPPAVSTVEINTKNDVNRSTVDPGTGKPDLNTAQVFFEFDIAIPTAKVQVKSAKGGYFTGAPATVSKGGSRVSFDYVATSDPTATQDVLTVNLIDPSTGKVIATDSTTITINDTPVIPNS